MGNHVFWLEQERLPGMAAVCPFSGVAVKCDGVSKELGSPVAWTIGRELATHLGERYPGFLSFSLSPPPFFCSFTCSSR